MLVLQSLSCKDGERGASGAGFGSLARPAPPCTPGNLPRRKLLRRRWKLMSLVQHAAIHNYPRTDYQIGRMLLSEAVEVGSNVLLLKGVGLDALSQVIVSLHLQKTCWRISAGPPPHLEHMAEDMRYPVPTTNNVPFHAEQGVLKSARHSSKM